MRGELRRMRRFAADIVFRGVIKRVEEVSASETSIN